MTGAAKPQLTTKVSDMVAAAKARIEELTPEQAIARADDPGTQFVDLRDVRERGHSGFVPGSFHCPRGMLEFWVDPDSPYFKDVFAQDKSYVFYCAAGWRSALAVATLQDMGFKAAHIIDGFAGWEKAGGPVATKPPKS